MNTLMKVSRFLYGRFSDQQLNLIALGLTVTILVVAALEVEGAL